MGSILVSVPDISDADLVFDEDETKQILTFFWPHAAPDIEKLAVDNEVRRLAQSMLIAAIDGSYAMGFIEALGKTIVRPGPNIRSLVRKLARRFARHWWNHATQEDLEDVRIYESLRRSIALHLKDRLDLLRNGAAIRRLTPFYALVGSSPVIWS